MCDTHNRCSVAIPCDHPVINREKKHHSTEDRDRPVHGRPCRARGTGEELENPDDEQEHYGDDIDELAVFPEAESRSGQGLVASTSAEEEACDADHVAAQETGVDQRDDHSVCGGAPDDDACDDDGEG